MTDELPDERPQRRREYSGAGSTLGVAALVVIAVGLSLWFFEFRDRAGGEGTAPGLGVIALPEGYNTSGKAEAAEVGRTAPNFRLETTDGERAALDEYRGRWVVVNFWASWCGPCRGETPDLQRMYEAAKGDELVVLGVNQQEEPSTAKTFAEQFDVTYPVLLDRSGEVSQAYRVGRGLPVTFLLDPDGVVEKVYLGRLSDAALVEIAKLSGVAK